MKLTIFGPPRTKKNHQRIVRMGNRARLIQSAAAIAWADYAVLQLRSQMAKTGVKIVNWPVSVKALIYRDRRVGDLNGYMQAIGDALERAGVIANDSLIESWDGTRKLFDKETPRVEITVTDVQDHAWLCYRDPHGRDSEEKDRLRALEEEGSAQGLAGRR